MSRTWRDIAAGGVLSALIGWLASMLAGRLAGEAGIRLVALAALFALPGIVIGCTRALCAALRGASGRGAPPDADQGGARDTDAEEN